MPVYNPPAVEAPVDSVAALKAINTTSAASFPTGTVRNVTGYYSAGDAAGARTYLLKRASVAADNSGTVIAPTTGTGATVRRAIAW